jgi:hypothetical protein
MTFGAEWDLFAVDRCHLLVERVELGVYRLDVFNMVHLNSFARSATGAYIVKVINCSECSVYYP